ncbi:MAG: FAD binding domain-containing protein, partial [Planctomycetes bacterium]|nr:FAD binding domain-containing protein [Planctomycetota bacterium]
MVNVRYFEPTSLKEASDILNHAGNNACILAGGTDLIVK